MQLNLRNALEVLPARTHIRLLLTGNTLIAFGKRIYSIPSPLCFDSLFGGIGSYMRQLFGKSDVEILVKQHVLCTFWYEIIELQLLL